MDDIVLKLKPLDVICLDETGLKGSNKVKLDGFFSFCKNRVDKAMGGVSTSVGKELKPFTVKVTESEKGDEYLITRLDHCLPPINIIAFDGMQESKAEKDDIINSWERPC